MKTNYTVFFFLIFFSMVRAQTGTIKIQKPAPPPVVKDTVIPKYSMQHFYVEGNYTFKQNKKTGIDAGFIYFPKAAAHNILGIGLEWDLEQQYYLLSPFNTKTMQADEAHLHSQTKSSYLKAQAVFRYPILYNTGKRSSGFYILAGITAKYLLQAENEHHRLSYSDFNQYNANGFMALDIPFGKGHYSFGLKYSKDFLENLKDRTIYDEYGTAVGKVRSKTQVLSFSLKYIIRH